MENELLSSFIGFLAKYREAWNGLNASKMATHSSKELKVRWANSDATVDDWGHVAAEKGWEQAYKMYDGRNPKWHFEDILMEINKNQEGIAVFWVRFEIDGELTDTKLLFMEAFRKENNEWKKIREYVENGFTAVSTLIN